MHIQPSDKQIESMPLDELIKLKARLEKGRDRTNCLIKQHELWIEQAKRRLEASI